MKKLSHSRTTNKQTALREFDASELAAQLTARFPANAEHTPWLMNVSSGNDVSQERDLAVTISKFLTVCSEHGVAAPETAILFYLPRPFGFAAFILASGKDATLECDSNEFFGRIIQQNEFGALWEFQHKPARAKYKGTVKVCQKGTQVFATLPVAWDVKWFIEESNSVCARGWIVDTINPRMPIKISVFLCGKVIATGQRTMSRGDVAEALSVDNDKLGFEVRYPAPTEPLYNIRVRPSGVDFDLVSGGSNFVGNQYSQSFTRQLRRALDRVVCQNALEDRFITLLKKQIKPDTYGEFLKGATKLLPVLLPRPANTSSLSVIIPVYSGYEETIKCIDSVLSSKTKLSLEILIGYDAGPDDRLKAHLEGLADPRVKVDYRAKNLGFVKNVNQLVSKKSCQDFILLNADTVVGDFLFDRLVHALDLDRSYASISPLSNNATIFSIYHAPRNLDSQFLEDTNSRLHQQWQHTIVPTPVSHGYCMLVNGDAYSLCGLFDEETWGKGYGEETDWCQRVFSRTGMRHGAMLGAYVFHEGSVSFGLNQMHTRVAAASSIINERYPEYQETVESYQILGALNQKKIQTDIALLRERINGPLIITHHFGGGVDTYVNARIKEFERDGVPYIVAQYFHTDGAPYWKLSGCVVTERYFSVDALPKMILWLKNLGINSINFEHSGEASLEEVVNLVEALGLPVRTNLHDFALLCPRINLLDYANRYCSVQDEVTCEICIGQGGVADSSKRAFSKTGSVSNLRRTATKLMSMSTEVYSPSSNTKDLYQKVFPKIAIKAKPHHGAIKFNQRKAKAASSRTVCVIGAISAAKGMVRYKELADYLQRKDPSIRIVVIGYTQNDAIFSTNPNVKITGKYAISDLARLVEQYDATACLHLNCWPETFSYTLSESLSAGLYPFYTAIGAVGERLKQARLGRGYTLDTSISTIAADIIEFFNGEVL